MSDIESVLSTIKEKNIQFVDFRFTDPRGKMQHTAQHIDTVDADLLAEGIMFDGSSIAGWKDISQSDMTLQPDLATAYVDPFMQVETLAIFCDVLEPSTGQPYERDPRSTAKRAEAYMKQAGIGDTAVFGPEAEFFMFDDVRFSTSQNHTFYKFNDVEGPYNSGNEEEVGTDQNLGHRPGPKGGYFPVPPVDRFTDIRSEMVSTMKEVGVPVEKHHHEVAPSQHELGIKFDTLVRCGDNLQLYKYVVHNVAHSYGKTATFMPKPVVGDNGSGMHVHQSIWKDGVPQFAGDGYAGLSELALYYIGGILKHAKALNAFTNATTNSYKRLVPGFEAPVLLAYSARNRSASCRIPHGSSPKSKRVEVRFPDASGNPYLAFSAMLMAGLDGVRNRIHPGEAMDKNLYDLPPEELAGIPTVCRSLREALESLQADHDFLLAGDVFTADQIEGYIELKEQEALAFEMHPHPIEYAMYYSV